MQSLKTSSKVLNSFLALVTILILGSSVSAKIAALDLISIYESYSLVQEANQVIDEAEAKFKRIVTTADAEIKELEKKGNEAEIIKKQNEIQDIVDEEVENLHDQKDLYNTTINRNIQKTLSAIAKEKGYELILDKSFVMNEIEDISDEFITKLEKETTSLKPKEAVTSPRPTKVN